MYKGRLRIFSVSFLKIEYWCSLGYLELVLKLLSSFDFEYLCRLDGDFHLLRVAKLFHPCILDINTRGHFVVHSVRTFESDARLACLVLLDNCGNFALWHFRLLA